MALVLCISAARPGIYKLGSSGSSSFTKTLIPLPSVSSSSFLPRRSSSFGSLAGLPGPRESDSSTAREQGERSSRDVAEEMKFGGAMATAIEESMPTRDFVTIAACAVGLLTGIGVVLFNNAVHEIRDFFWDGLPSRGASWLREKPLEEVWQQVILVPVCGGVIVGMLNSLQGSLQAPSEGMLSYLKGALRPFLKAIAASVTLGTGNSLGPEGPSVEIGSAIAKGVGRIFEWRGDKKLSLVAAGSAAGISSGPFSIFGALACFLLV